MDSQAEEVPRVRAESVTALGSGLPVALSLMQVMDSVHSSGIIFLNQPAPCNIDKNLILDARPEAAGA